MRFKTGDEVYCHKLPNGETYMGTIVKIDRDYGGAWPIQVTPAYGLNGTKDRALIIVDEAECLLQSELTSLEKALYGI